MDNFDKLLVNVIGDVMVSAGVVAYLGSFTVSLMREIDSEIAVMELMHVIKKPYKS